MRPPSGSSKTPNDYANRLLRTSYAGRITPRRPNPSTAALKDVFINSREREALMTACAKGDADRVNHLLQYSEPKINPDMVRDSKLRTPLLVACAGGRAEVVRILIRWGADVNNPMGDIVGNKPLDLAVISNSVPTVLALLQAGAKVTLPKPAPMPPDDGVPLPVQQRLSSRSPLSLAYSRLDLLIRQRGEKGPTDEQAQQTMMNQVLEIIDLLKHFFNKENLPAESSSSSADYTDTIQELDDLSSKLSNMGINGDTATTASKTSAAQENTVDDVMKGLQQVISKLTI